MSQAGNRSDVRRDGRPGILGHIGARSLGLIAAFALTISLLGEVPSEATIRTQADEPAINYNHLAAHLPTAYGTGADLPTLGPVSAGGHVLVEIGPTQARAVGAFFADAGAETQVIHDLDGRDRVILARFSA